MSSFTKDNCEAQLAEVEIMEAAYSDSFRLQEEAGQSGDVAFDIVMDELSIRFYVPPDYPVSPVRFLLNVVKTLNNSEKAEVSGTIQNSIDTADKDSMLGCMEICQMAIDLSRECMEVKEVMMRSAKEDISVPIKRRMSRFLIYFHHIMSGKKRVAIVENARELGLGGYSKRGFPGIVIVEGFDNNVLEYVRRIQHLRWQQMVVRGEEFDDYTEESGESGCTRKFPLPFREIEGDSMSDIATLCEESGCRDLFMTSMKKY